MPNHNSVQMNFISLITLFVVISSIFSCQKSQNSSPEEGFASYKFEKEREFLIHSLSTIELLDYYPEDSLFLGYTNTHSGKEICLVKENGEIVLSRHMQGEGPNQYPSNLSCLGFAENGDIWAMTSVQVFRYDQELNLREKFTYESNHMITLYTISKKFYYYRKDPLSREITFPTIPSGVSPFNSKSFEKIQNAKLLDLYDQGQETVMEFAPIFERQVTEEFLRISGGVYAPIFMIDTIDFKLYLTSTIDNEITIYDLNTDTFSARLDIHHGDPSALEPSTKIKTETLTKNSEGWLLTPKNHNIHKLDQGIFALEYLMGTSINPNAIKGTQLGESKEDIYQNRLIMFDQNRQLSGDLALPVKGIIMTSLPGNRLLVRVENSEVEEDFTRYVIIRVIKE